MPRIPKSISQFVPQQIPEFIRDDNTYKTFITFLEAYYSFLEQDGNLYQRAMGARDYSDIDYTLDAFISHFENEYLLNIPQSLFNDPVNGHVDKRTLAKHIQDFYRARGSEKSYKLLFRILFNEDVEFYYPKVDILRGSDGKWSVDNVIRTTSTTDTFTWIGHTITGQASGATANVENVLQFQIGLNLVSEIYLSQIVGSFQTNETIVCNIDGLPFEKCFPLIADIRITNPGTGYKVGDQIIISGGGGQDATAQVSLITGKDIGRVQSQVVTDLFTATIAGNSASHPIASNGFAGWIQFSAPSTNLSSARVGDSDISSTRGISIPPGSSIFLPQGKYDMSKVFYRVETGDSLDIAASIYVAGNISNMIMLAPTAKAANNFYNGMEITITDGAGAGQTALINSYDGLTKIATITTTWTTIPNISSHYSISLGGIRQIEITNFGLNYTSVPSVSFPTGNGDATGVAVIQALGTYKGHYVSTDGFLSSNKKLQDSLFWQDFSYVLKVGISINTYRDYVKRLLHPAGLIMFGEVDVLSRYLISPTYRSLEQNKFFFAPYNHFGLEYPTYPFGQGSPATPTPLVYATPNNNYWGDPAGATNTPLSIYSNTTIGDVISKPMTKRNHVADPYLYISKHVHAIPRGQMVAQYDFLQETNPLILYDISI